MDTIGSRSPVLPVLITSARTAFCDAADRSADTFSRRPLRDERGMSRVDNPLHRGNDLSSLPSIRGLPFLIQFRFQNCHHGRAGTSIGGSAHHCLQRLAADVPLRRFSVGLLGWVSAHSLKCSVIQRQHPFHQGAPSALFIRPDRPVKSSDVLNAAQQLVSKILGYRHCRLLLSVNERMGQLLIQRRHSPDYGVECAALDLVQSSA